MEEKCIAEEKRAGDDGNTALLTAAFNGQLSTVQWLLTEGGASIDEADEDGYTALMNASGNGHLPTVQWLLREGGASIAEADSHGLGTALQNAIELRHLPMVQWLVAEGGASIAEADEDGFTALLLAANTGDFPTVQWLLTEGGASIAEATAHGDSVYDLLKPWLLTIDDDGDQHYAQPTSFLKVVALLDSPPRDFKDRLSPQHRELLSRGALIRAQRAQCLASRAAAIRDHCQLLPGLVDFVVAFAEPSIDDLYEDVYFTQRSRLRRRGPQVPLRRSLRLRQKRG